MICLLLPLLLVAGARAQTASECLTCTANTGVTGGVYCIASGAKCVNSTALCAQPTSACTTTQCCTAYFTQPTYCSLYQNTGTCQKQVNCTLDWVRSTEGANGCGQLSFEYRCCVKRPTACSFRGNSGVCTKQIYCNNLAWVSQTTGAVGCESEPADVRCCAQNTPKPTPFVPGPTDPATTTTTTTTAGGDAPTTTPAATPPTTTALQMFTTGNKVADCASVFRCAGGVCILDGQCACQLPLIQHPTLGCTQSEAISTPCRARPCNSDPAAPFCAVLNDDAFCFAANGTFVPRARFEPTISAPASDVHSNTIVVTPDSDAGFPLAAIIAIVVVVVVLALVAGVVGAVCVVRKRRQSRISEQQQHFHGAAAAPAAKSRSGGKKKDADDGNAIVMTAAAENYAETTVAKGGASQTTDYASMPGTTTTTLKGPYMSDAAYIGDVKREQPLF
jgi:hypothetical protein